MCNPVRHCKANDDTFEAQNIKRFAVSRFHRHWRLADQCGLILSEQVAEIIAFLSEGTTLLPGTVILTGTPEGVGFTRDPPRHLSPGDTVTVSVEGIGIVVDELSFRHNRDFPKYNRVTPLSFRKT